MNPIVKLSRRDFVKSTGLLVLGVSMAGCSRGGNPAQTGAGSAAAPWSPAVFVSIDADGTVFIVEILGTQYLIIQPLFWPRILFCQN